jgi:hypothetical protein
MTILTTPQEFSTKGDYIEGFEAGEAHTLFWIQQWYMDGLTIHEIIERLEGSIQPWWNL